MLNSLKKEILLSIADQIQKYKLRKYLLLRQQQKNKKKKQIQSNRVSVKRLKDKYYFVLSILKVMRISELQEMNHTYL